MNETLPTSGKTARKLSNVCWLCVHVQQKEVSWVRHVLIDLQAVWMRLNMNITYRLFTTTKARNSWCLVQRQRCTTFTSQTVPTETPKTRLKNKLPHKASVRSLWLIIALKPEHTYPNRKQVNVNMRQHFAFPKKSKNLGNVLRMSVKLCVLLCPWPWLPFSKWRKAPDLKYWLTIRRSPPLCFSPAASAQAPPMLLLLVWCYFRPPCPLLLLLLLFLPYLPSHSWCPGTLACMHALTFSVSLHFPHLWLFPHVKHLHLFHFRLFCSSFVSHTELGR